MSRERTIVNRLTPMRRGNSSGSAPRAITDTTNGDPARAASGSFEDVDVVNEESVSINWEAPVPRVRPRPQTGTRPWRSPTRRCVGVGPATAMDHRGARQSALGSLDAAS